MSDSSSSPFPQPNHNSNWGPARFVAGLLSLLLRSAGEVTRIAGEMHGVIRQKPLPLANHPEPELALAPRLYQLINLAFVYSATQLQKAVPLLPAAPQTSAQWSRLQSVMNGVFGDKLYDWEHPAAINMECLDRQHNPVTLATLQQQHSKGVALFIHGLCLSEHEWSSPQAQFFADLLQQQGYGVALLRYNTGLTLQENGERLAHLLNSQWQSDSHQKLMLFGHSMGGLVARSAMHHAMDIHEHQWIKNVSHAAYIASPHEGANLEKLGNFANDLLGYSPYTKPLMALGNIRSRGIRSLRQARIRHKNAIDRKDLELFNPEIHHLLLGARLSDPAAKAILGDGLVTDASAMGKSHFPDEHEQVTRIFIDEVGHLRLLSDQRLYRVLSLWLHHTTMG